MINSIQIVPNIDQEASGPSYSVVRLCQALKAAGDDTKLAVLKPKPTAADYDFARYFPYGLGPKKLGISPEMKQWLRKEALSGDCKIMHNHSLWMLTNTYAASAVRGTSCNLVVSPRGTLSAVAMARTGWAKFILKPVMFKPVMQNATAFHATSNQEYRDIRTQGFEQPVAVLPNGVDIPEITAKKTCNKRRLLFLGRIHPIKGIDNLLKAWQMVQVSYPDWELIIAGPGEDKHVEELKNLAFELNLERCQFSGPLYGKEKLLAYRQAGIYVLPTHSENFGMTVAEALAAGTPTIVTKGAPWNGLEQEKAGWWIDIGVEPLADALKIALEMSPAQLEKMGDNGRNWMKRDFSWKKIGKNMHEFYSWLINGGVLSDGKVPDFVKLD